MLAPLQSLKMENYVKEKLKTKQLKRIGSDGGCINRAGIYETDNGKVFIKYNTDSEAKIMFKGEFESLEKINQTQTVKVPKPYLVGNIGQNCFIVMEYMMMKPLKKYSSSLGTSLAEMHLNNIKKLRNGNKGQFIGDQSSGVEKFGFDIPTACGLIPQNNQWSDDWVTFYSSQKLGQQINLIIQKEGNRELNELWSELQLKIPLLFKDTNIQPSLLHGDLWIGNAAETDSEPVIFDPASFYGHHEYDLAIAAMFGGFGKSFYDSYHSLIPKSPGFKERHQLYLLFHHLNHWNHFGSHKESSKQIIKGLISCK